MTIHVVDHPIIATKLSVLRQSSISSALFRQTVHEISLLLGYEASRSLPTTTFQAESPISPFTGQRIAPRVALAPILRAGIAMTDALLSLHPDATVFHLGLFREKVTLQPVEYYNRLPDKQASDVVFVLDPMVATAGTATAALKMVEDSGVPIKNIKFIAILASDSGLKTLEEEFPELDLWVAAIDPEIVTHNGESGTIKPGLGDAGDRLFQTQRQ